MAVVSLLLAGTGAVATQPATAAETPENLIDSASTTWTYSEDNTNPSTGNDRLSWTKSGFDTTGWKSAKGSFGAKRGEATGIGGGFSINTLLNQYIDGKDAPTIPTYHFRTTIDLSAADLDSLNKLEGTIVHDDAAQVFVNGTKVAGFDDDAVEAADESERNLMYAGVSAGDPKESTFDLDSSDFKVGKNTVSVALYQDRDTSSDIYFDFVKLAAASDDATDPDEEAKPTDIVMTVGGSEAERNVTWYSDVDTDQQLQLAAAAESGGEFPVAKAKTIDATAAAGKTTSGQYRRSAAITGLKENSKYIYRVGSDKNGWSEPYKFSTASFDGDYDFLFFGDPQIGASGNVANDQAGWEDTVNVGMKAFPSSELLFSAGDQVESAPNEEHYDAFLAPKQLREMPLVPTNGNHDVGSKAYEQHFTVPNNDPNSGAGTATSSGGDYWFMYKDVLYLNINSNNGDVAAHKAFLEKVVAEQGDKAKWKVLAFHHSIYSVASHTNDQQILDLRGTLPKIISDLGIDLVLQGHDHSYTRSYLIKDGELADPSEVAGNDKVTAAPGEVLYVTANSASGSKYYDVKAPDAWFASVINQEKVRNYSHISVTDNSIKVSTMRSQAHGDSAVNTLVDEVTLQREDKVAPELNVPQRTEIKVGDDFDPLDGITAKDAVDGDLTAAVKVTGDVDTQSEGSYDLTYSVADAAGNEATAKRTVVVTAVTNGDDSDGSSDGSGDGHETKPNVTVTGDLVAGGDITVKSAGLNADTKHNVYLHSDPVLLTRATSDAKGVFTAKATIPADARAGKHLVTVETEDGTVVASKEITLAATEIGNGAGVPVPTPDDGSDAVSSGSDTKPVSGSHAVAADSQLAQTGMQISGLVLAVLVIALGVVLLVVRRRASARS